MALPAAPIILVTTAHPSLYQHPGPAGEAVHPRLGRLLQPRHLSSVEVTAAAGIPWACDNDCFQGLNEVAFVKMLDRVTGLPGCLFVTVPDVVADAAATRESFDRWAPELERRGLPLALVAQDGMTVDELDELAPRLAALFIGGSTEWKEGPAAAELAAEAKRRGLWVHWGRVNTRRRFDLIVATGAADSFDGSKWARFRTTYLPGGLRWLDEAVEARRVALAAPALERLERDEDLGRVRRAIAVRREQIAARADLEHVGPFRQARNDLAALLELEADLDEVLEARAADAVVGAAHNLADALDSFEAALAAGVPVQALLEAQASRLEVLR